ncbi:hypothetical protein [Streptomyces sp. NPDC004435]|uniref:hypothetical protein n=1 Tax=Streptomyces sp. NPDC004435 TaxID=3364701 RepID=UPI0036B63569
MSAPVIDRAGRARDAVTHERWAEAYTLLHARDRHPDEALTPEDLGALSDAAWWSGHLDESVAARLRAHSAHVAAGDHRGAGLAAWWLHHEYEGLGRPAVAAGWLHRARHHLDGLPACPEQSFLAWADAEEAIARGDGAAALAATGRMTRLAEASGSPDLLALSRQAPRPVAEEKEPAGASAQETVRAEASSRSTSSGGRPSAVPTVPRTSCSAGL